MTTNDTWPRLPALVGWVVMLALVVAMVLAQRPPAPLGSEAAEAEFSAARALAVLRQVLGDERPHRLGTAENALVRERVVAAFAGIGLAAEVRSRFVCAEYGVCGTPHNLLVRLPGSAAEPAVLLTSHYDSVGAGPGAGDAGSGVAALVEIARALQTESGARREILILVADGEEAGLLGAEAFVHEPEFARVGVVVNLEARGTRGRANLFETQPGNAAVIAAVAPTLPYPTLSSLAYEIYTRMPNNTDFSVYKREARAGVNFAFIEGGERYHTPLDDLAHLDAGSLQQTGSNALAATRALARPGVAVQDTHNLVYFDLGGVAWHWPEAANPWLVLLAAALLASGLVRARRRGVLGYRDVAVAVLMLLALAAAVALSAWALQWAWRQAGALPMAWTANAGWLQLACALLAATIVLGGGARFVARRGASAWLAANLAALVLVSAALASVMPGAIPLALVPALCAGLVFALWPQRSLLLAVVLSAGLWLVNAASLVALYASLGPVALPGLALLVAWIVAPLAVTALALAPSSRRRAFVAGVIAAAISAVAATLASPFDVDTRAPLALREISGPDSRHLQLLGVAAGESASWTSALPAPAPPLRLPPWATSALPALPLDGPGTAPPQVELHALDASHSEIVLRTDDPEAVLGLALPVALPLDAVRVNDQTFAPAVRRQRAASGDWRTIHVYPSGDAVRIVIAWPAGMPRAGHALVMHSGLAPDLAPLAAARDRIAVPAHFGDARIGHVPLDFGAGAIGADDPAVRGATAVR